MLQIGTRVTQGSHEYVLKDLISSGGFGEAFLAEQTKPYIKKVVVKVPKPHIATHPVWSKKFAREARILANINHANVVGIIAFWEFKDAAGSVNEMALVQELVPGASNLDAYLGRNPNSAVSVFLQALYAVRAFHSPASPSVVHRDLSPRNILVGDTGVVKVIDFGLSKEDPRATQILTQTGEWFGTPGCMSPEQMLDAQSVDHRTDLYAMGRSFAAALQHRHPQHADPRALPEPWRTICGRLAEHDADKRYQTAAEALTAAMHLFAQDGAPIENFSLHAQEHRGCGAPDGWPELCGSHFHNLPELHQADLEEAALLDQSVLTHPAIAPQRLFDVFESSEAIADFAARNVSFEDGDALGTVYATIYPALDNQRRLACFGRVCENAIHLHRYSMMGSVRAMYGSEHDPALRQQLLQKLDELDSERIIHGWGIIPRVP